jgi:hypothetical protein
LPKNWSVNDIADVEVITGSASGVLAIRWWSLARRFWPCCLDFLQYSINKYWYNTWYRPWTVVSPSSQDSYKPVY